MDILGIIARMQETPRNPYVYVAAIIALVGIAGIAYMTYTKEKPALDSNIETEPVPITVTESGVTVSGGDVTVVEEKPAPSRPKAPDYKAPLSFSNSVSEEVRGALERQRTATIAQLDKNPTDFKVWINLGNIRHTAGDYKGAETVWTYAGVLYPKSPVPFDNLGWLYLDFLKDYPKSEANFTRAIANDSHDINAYEQLFSLYTVYGYKTGTSTAANLVESGLKANPGNQTLLQMQEQLKK